MRILHLFNWHLNKIDLYKIHEQGFDAIQINPLQPLKTDNSDDWWISYQPIDFKIGNKFGDKEDLINLCNGAKKYSIKIIADIVLNHMASKDNGECYPHELVNYDLVSNISYWKNFDRIYNWEDREEVINKSIGCPGLDLSNYDLQNIILNFLQEYIDCGINGFRFDAAKNIALPEEGNSFWIRIDDFLKNKDLYNYAEVIFCDKDLIDRYCKYINVVTNSFGSDKNKLVVYVENHDSYLEFACTRNLDNNSMLSEYKILVDNFPNTLFYARPYNNLWESESIKYINIKKIKQ